MADLHQLEQERRAEWAAALAPQLAELLKNDVVIAVKKSVPPLADAVGARPSLPVQAAQGTVKLTRLGFALLGFLTALAEVVATDHSVLRAIFRALWERVQ